MITDEAIHNIFQKNPCKNTDYNQGSTLTKTWDINGHRISNTHLWSVISTPISDMRMCISITMITIKIIPLRIHTKVQPTTIYIYSSNLAHTWVYSIHYVIKFVSDLRQVGNVLRVIRFPPLIKLTDTI